MGNNSYHIVLSYMGNRELGTLGPAVASARPTKMGSCKHFSCQHGGDAIGLAVGNPGTGFIMSDNFPLNVASIDKSPFSLPWGKEQSMQDNIAMGGSAIGTDELVDNMGECTSTL
jgi:hypothetical protein